MAGVLNNRDGVVATILRCCYSFHPVSADLLGGHTLSQLTFALFTLQLQSLDSILQPFLLLYQSPELRRFSSISLLSIPIGILATA